MSIEDHKEVSRVVIIDDSYEEGSALQRALNDEGISSVLYCDENITNLRNKLPSEPIKSCRLVFLDLDFQGIADTNPKSKADRPAQFLKTVVGNIGAYILIVWSSRTTERISKDFIKRLYQKADQISSPVVKPILLEKSDFKDHNGNFKVDALREKILNSLNHIPAFSLFMRGEKLTLDGVSDMFSKVISKKDDKQLNGVINELARASVGQNVSNDRMLQEAFIAFGEFIQDSIEAQILEHQFDPSKVSEDKLGSKDKSALNKNLMFSENVSEITSGAIYEYTPEIKELKLMVKGVFSQQYKQDFANRFCRTKFTYVIIDVTQLCDSGKEEGCRYFVKGIIHPESFKKNRIAKPKDIKQAADGAYMLQKSFDFNGRSNHKLTINLKTYSTHQKIDGFTPTLRLRSSIVIDIQHKIAAHISRPGHLWL